MRYVVMKQGDIWYVTFGPDKTDETAESMSRSTRTFKSEVDAKLFAMQILSKGWTASAGTLNPHQPKQVVGPAQIEHWAEPAVGGEQQVRSLSRLRGRVGVGVPQRVALFGWRLHPRHDL
jgi:hypothetical protein